MNVRIRTSIVGVLLGVFLIVPAASYAQYVVEEQDPNIIRTLNTVFFGDPNGPQDPTAKDPWEHVSPAVSTVTISRIGRTSAEVQVYYSSNGAVYSVDNAPILYVEYGDDRDMEQRTVGVSQPTGSRTTSFSLTGLNENDTYYVRAVVLYGGRVGYGERLSFETGVSNQSGQQSTTGGTLHQGGNAYVPPPAPAPNPKPAPKPSVKPKDKDTSILGPSIFGEGFFPQTLLGWVIIIGLIIIIVFLVLGALKKK